MLTLNMGKTVIFYRTVDGKCPVQDFLDSLSGKVAQKVTWVLKLLEELYVVPASYFKKLTGTERSGSAEFNLPRMHIGYSAFSRVIQ
jgi:hypothetical protein